MFEQIMVPLDGSARAERAVPYAEQLCAATGARLYLVRVVDVTGWPSYLSSNLHDRLLKGESRAAVTYLANISERLSRPSTHPVRTSQSRGYVADTLLEYEREVGIDLVIMSSHGHTGLARFGLGSVADRLIRHGRAPVLLVRAFGGAPALHHALVPLDGSSLAETALLLVDQLSREVVREVTLLRVVQDEEHLPEAGAYLEETRRSRLREGMACRQCVERGDPAAQIIDLAGSERLVVMATHGRGGLARWTLGSVADRVTRHGRAALLLARAGTVRS